MRYLKKLISLVLVLTLTVFALTVMTPTVSAATVSVNLVPGTLTITAAPVDFAYTGYTLDGTVHTLTGSFAVSVNDATGSKAGWKLQGAIGVLTNTNGDTIPAANHTIQGVSVAAGTGISPSNSITYPMQIPTGAASIFNAALDSGKGKSTETFNTQLIVPADVAAGQYSATLTVSIVSGP